jgi:hypothetical protein
MKISAKRVVTSADRADRAALKAAIAVVRKHRERARELAELERQVGWLEAAKVAVFDCQSRALRLPPWEEVPCRASIRGKGRAARLLRRMLRRGVSRWQPDPSRAIAEAGPRPR